MKLLLTVFAILVIIAALATPLHSQSMPITSRSTFTSSGPMVVFSLTGQGICSYGMSGTGSATITPMGASDGGYTYAVINLPGFGAQTSNGAYGGWLAPNPGPPILTNFYVQVTVVSGTVTVWESCSNANPGGNNVIASLPPVTLASGAAVMVLNTPGFVCISGCAGGGGGATPIPTPTGGIYPVAQASVPWSVTTPAPCSTPTCNSVVWQGTSPWTVNTINPSLPAPQVTWPVTTPAPCATPTCNQVVWQGTTLWNVNTPAPYVAPTCSALPNAPCVQLTGAPIPGTTPIPFPTLGVVQQAAPAATTPVSCAAAANCPVNATQVTSPWVVGQTTGTNLHVVTDNASPIPGLTPIPFPTGTTNPASVAAFTSSTGTTVMPPGCNSAPIPINITTATTTLLGANAAGVKWHICFISIYVVSGTTPGFLFETGGTGTCSGPTAITGTYGGIASAIGQLFQFGTGLGQIMQTTGANSSWCIVSTGTLPNLQGFAEAGQY